MGELLARSNPMSDRFSVLGFHHIELYCGDAANTWRRFAWGLGLRLTALSDLSTGNPVYASYATRSGNVTLLFTAPYSPSGSRNPPHAAPAAAAAAAPPPARTRLPLPWFDPHAAAAFFCTHGLAVRAVALRVADAAAAYASAISGGGRGVAPPLTLRDDVTGDVATLAEVALYGDVVLRLVSYRDGDCDGSSFLPYYVRARTPPGHRELLSRIDHAVGNVPALAEAAAYVAGMTGFHEFAEFGAAEVGTAESGLNSVVLANNDETVLLPLNEPVHGTKRRSQIQTFLDHNDGPGLQHLALLVDDIFVSLREMRMRSELGGFEFMPPPNDAYYKQLPERIGDSLSKEQVELCREFGLLVDKDDQGVLLQIFTKPVGDRPTLFLEIIQRIGCMESVEKNGELVVEQRPACGGFGKGNFAALFKAIEDYERTLES